MKKNNAKTLVPVILAACMLILGACGKTEEQAAMGADTNPAAEGTEKVDDKTKDTKPEPVDVIADVDVVIGSEVMPVNESSTAAHDFTLDNFPEIHILVPSDNITCTIEDGDSHCRQYEIAIPGCDYSAQCCISFSGPNDDYCGVGHIGYIESDGYIVDYCWCSIAVKDKATETAIEIMFFYTGDGAEEKGEFIRTLTELNLEYIKAQSDGWKPNTYDGTENTANSDVLDEDFGIMTYKNNETDAVINIENLFTEDAKLSAVDGVGYTYEYPLVQKTDTIWSAMDGGKEMLYIEIADGKLKCDMDYEDCCNLYGDYTLVETSAGAENTTDSGGALECDIIPCGKYDLDGNKYVMVSTYDDDDSGECMLMFGRYDGADSPSDYYDLENVANNTYSATNWDKVSVTVTFSDGGMDLSGGTGELKEFNGHYTLQ